MVLLGHIEGRESDESDKEQYSGEGHIGSDSELDREVAEMMIVR